jgi:hypothetical protein
MNISFWNILQIIIWIVGIWAFIYLLIKQKNKQPQDATEGQTAKKLLHIPLSSYVMIVALITTVAGWLINTFAPDNSLIGIVFIAFMLLAAIGIIPIVIINKRYSQTIKEQGEKTQQQK